MKAQHEVQWQRACLGQTRALAPPMAGQKQRGQQTNPWVPARRTMSYILPKLCTMDAFQR